MRSFMIGTAVLAVALAHPATAATYVALGDSITFGETDLRYVASNGVRGYVDDFATILAARSGGAPLNVINLAIDGETAGSFFSGFGRTPPVTGRGDLPLALQNTNYSGFIPLTQSQTFLQDVAQVKAAGDTVSTISISLGFNELAALSSLPPTTASAAIASTLATYRTEYGAVLAQIRSVAPTANLYVLGYYNPFPGDNNSTVNPASAFFASGGSQLNAVIQDLARQYSATYVDTFTPFVGREAELTYIDEVGNGDRTPAPYSSTDAGLAPIGNVHPTEQGYAVIARQLAVSIVPEPESWAMMIAGFALTGLALRGRRRPLATVPRRVDGLG